MGRSRVDGYAWSLKKHRKNSFLQYSLVFKDQADEEIVCVNHVRATLSCFETCRKYYLSCPFGEIVKHRSQNSTSQMRFKFRVRDVPAVARRKPLRRTLLLEPGLPAVHDLKSGRQFK